MERSNLFIKCTREEATHVRVLEQDDEEDAIHANVTVGEVYKILRNTERGFEGEEIIKNNIGHNVCSFSLFLYVDWLKEAH